MPKKPKSKVNTKKSCKGKKCKSRSKTSAAKSKSKQNASQVVKVNVVGGQGGGGGGGAGGGGGFQMPMPQYYPMHHSFATYDMGHRVRVNENANGSFTRSDFSGGGNPQPAGSARHSPPESYYGGNPPPEQMDMLSIRSLEAAKPASVQGDIAEAPLFGNIDLNLAPLGRSAGGPVRKDPQAARAARRFNPMAMVKEASTPAANREKPDNENNEDQRGAGGPVRRRREVDRFAPMHGVLVRPRAISHGIAIADNARVRNHDVIPRAEVNVNPVVPRLDARAHSHNSHEEPGVQIRETRWDIPPPLEAKKEVRLGPPIDDALRPRAPAFSKVAKRISGKRKEETETAMKSAKARAAASKVTQRVRKEETETAMKSAKARAAAAQVTAKILKTKTD